MGEDPSGFTVRDWKDLFHYVNEGNTTPFLGAGITRKHFGSASELAEEIAGEFGYPFRDISNLAKVAQLAEITGGDPFRVRKFVADYIKGKELPDFNNPLEPHRVLARLDLPIYITTDYDHHMFEALKYDGKNPIIEFCRWNDLTEIQGKSSVFDKIVPHSFDYKNPLVYHIHGEVDNPQSMVLTEDDYLNFVVKLQLDFDKLFPSQIRIAFGSSSIIFIGYSLSDWNLRIILRKIAAGMNSVVPLHCSIQLAPTDINSEDESEKIREYLKKYLETVQKVNLKIYWGNATDFCRKLAEQGESLQRKRSVYAN